MPAFSKSLSPDDAYKLLKTSCELMWGADRTKELDAALKTAGRNLSVIFSVPLSMRDGEPDYYDNAAEGWAAEDRRIAE